MMSGIMGNDEKKGNYDEEEASKLFGEDSEDESEGIHDQDEDDLECVKCEPNEEAPLKISKSPYTPTSEERERHYVAGHLPYRSWCHVCIQAKGKEDDHRRQKKKSEGSKPIITMDYKTFAQSQDESNMTSLVIRDSKTSMVASHICEKKGGEDKWILDQVVADIDQWGYTDIILKTDGEPAIVDVAERVKKRRAHPTILQNPPAYDPASNGVAEHAVQDFMGQMRACKLSLEQRVKVEIPSNASIIQWLAEHASFTLNRGLIGHDGKSPYARLMGKHSSKAILEFGEQILAKPLRTPQTRRKLSLRSKWVFGTWVGMSASRMNIL
jgi:hypothetical protein